jgi:hypothetical protein
MEALPSEPGLVYTAIFKRARNPREPKQTILTRDIDFPGKCDVAKSPISVRNRSISRLPGMEQRTL